MSEFACGMIRELIPDFVASRLGEDDLEAVEAHVTECAECRGELELAQMILASRSRVPAGLLDRVTRAVSADRRGPSRPWWGISAAAVAALALGIGMSSERSSGPMDVPGFAYEVEEGDVWLSDDGLVAGAPMFDGLSDEALVALLDELSLEGPGGAV
jgi:anti-sigma factor RsiW